MLENIIYHIAAIVLITILAIYLFLLYKKYTHLKVSIIPFMLKKEFILPKDRSFFIRGIRAIEAMLTQKFGIQIYLKHDVSRKSFFFSEFEVFLNLIFSDNNKYALESEKLIERITLYKEKTKKNNLPKKKEIVFLMQNKNSDIIYNKDNPNDFFHKNNHSVWDISV